MKKLSLIPALLLFSACVTPNVAVNPRADFAAIKRVAVLSFNGPQGDLAADLMTQSLVARGADVVERQRLADVMKEQSLSNSGSFDPATAQKLGKLLGVDALFVGTVSESTPQTSYLVTQAGGKSVFQPATVTQVGGGSVYSEGSVMGIPNSQLLSTTANVSMLSRMVDVKTGTVLWSASMSYEGIDVQSAMSGITDAFVRSLAPIWPGLYNNPS